MATTADNPQKPLVSLSIPEDRPLNERELKDVLLALAGGINQLGDDVNQLNVNVNQLDVNVNQLGDDVKDIKSELKDWMGWLRVISGVIMVTVGVSFLGIVLPLGIALWRQSLN